MKAHPFIIELLQIVITLCVTLLQVTAKQNEEKKKSLKNNQNSWQEDTLGPFSQGM